MVGPSSSSSSLTPLPPLPLLLLLITCSADVREDCDLRAGRQDFMLDVEDAVIAGAALLETTRVPVAEDCERACCGNARCDLAQLEPPTAEGRRACGLFACVHRNRYVCRFVHQPGFDTYIRVGVFTKYLEGPQGAEAESSLVAVVGRDVIVQPGDSVLLNGTESFSVNSDIRDYRWEELSGENSLRMEKTSLVDQVRLSNLLPGQYIIQLTVTDGNRNQHSTNASVIVLSPEKTSLYCRAPVKVGPCRASFPRWRYNSSTGSCEHFVYGGCKGNNNNYVFEKECVSACRGVTASSERSVSPAKVCGSACASDHITCSDGCCLHRSLECDGVTHCINQSDEEHCSKLNQTFNRLLSISVDHRKAVCTEPPVTGPCRASFSRWFYNPLDQKCSLFTYGGCLGNNNNFHDEATCGDACSGITEKDVFSRGLFEHFKDDESDSGSIALAVILAVAILALLAVCLYCFLQNRKKRSHRPVATGPAPMALSEQDTLVYNSTTKPV
ncbi:kunitz-type protease inhibitor 1-like [Gouania willdenowi]|uniref:kunitz-type protease inhibitor 1-like n=1 Tax=Gouania willdenowi TaxID=441366 RepID=UPI001054494C|nr:kunitz-type protease inhibitor 1-like [Gouania willdenowi]